jgi:RNA polymerase sigma-70 factor, ECF subfamily
MTGERISQLEARLLAGAHAVDPSEVRALRVRLWQASRTRGFLPSATRGVTAAAVPSDAALLRAFQAGDAEAMDALLARHLPTLYGFARRHLPSAASAEDCVHEGLLALIDALPGLEVRDDQVLALLFRFVYHRCLDWVRREALRSGPSLDESEQVSAGPDALQQLLTRLDLEQLVDALASECTLLEQQVVVLAAEGHSGAEIGAALELTANHVGVLKHRALQKLSRKTEPSP